VLTSVLSTLDRLDLRADGGHYRSEAMSLATDQLGSLSQTFFDAITGVGASRFSLRLIYDGKELHPADFLAARTGDGLVEHVTVRERVLLQYLRSGATVVFNHINEHVPEAQALQDRIEESTGSRCWIQCYVTRSRSSALQMHSDEHAFVVVQLFGKKEWRHAPTSSDMPERVVYEPGTVSFYPKRSVHDVHGLGELSMHLTMAFGGDIDGEIGEQRRRRGTGLPYSLEPQLVTEQTPARLALRHLAYTTDSERGLMVSTGASTVSISERFEDVLRHMAAAHSSTPAEVSVATGMDMRDIVRLWRFGFEQGLFLTPVI
jgi:hypothetical protein